MYNYLIVLKFIFKVNNLFHHRSIQSFTLAHLLALSFTNGQNTETASARQLKFKYNKSFSFLLKINAFAEYHTKIIAVLTKKIFLLYFFSYKNNLIFFFTRTRRILVYNFHKFVIYNHRQTVTIKCFKNRAF